MNDPTPPIQDGRYGHTTCARDGADVTRWIRRRAEAHGFELDAAQNRALQHFERLYEDLIGLERLEATLIRLLARKRMVQGIYLWGGVGRGKSFLMDSFFNCAPVARKRRIHFHRFMQEIHGALREHQGAAAPMLLVARDIARDTRFICLDEFHITDITDAMMMRRLLEGLFEQGVVLATTSNYQPDDLYPNGLQRSQFLPAIELIKQNLEIVNIDGGTDYRLRELEKAGIYHVDGAADAVMERAFRGIAHHEPGDAPELEIEGRIIRVRRHARGVAWFDFSELCGGPRGKADYIELARRYHTVLISAVPRFTPADADKLRRFMWLVDEFYDRRVKLIVTAQAYPEDLYPYAEGGGEFSRTISRLTEMQTRDYLSQPHLP